LARRGGDHSRPAVPHRKGGTIGARLSDQSVADIVKARAERVGLDPASFAGHSLRAGFLTSAAKGGVNIFKMMDVSGHRSVDTLRDTFATPSYFRITPGPACCSPR
jgi:hypothetical protein